MESAGRPAGEVIFGACARPSGSSSDLLKSWGGGGVAVADEARLSCSIFKVYRLLTSVTHALLSRCVYGVDTIGGKACI